MGLPPNMNIIVLGMHHSGTLALKRLLEMMGCRLTSDRDLSASLSDDFAPVPQTRLHHANDRLLASLGCSWVDCVDLSLHDLVPSEIEKCRQIAQLDLGESEETSPYILEDPRFSLVLDAWRPSLKDPFCLFAHRDPLAVARSLAAHTGFDLSWGSALWEQYNLCALKSVRDLPRMGIAYENLATEPIETAERLLEQLQAAGATGLTLPSSKELRGLIDSHIHSSEATPADSLPAPTEFQQVLLSGLRDGRAFTSDVPPLSEESKRVLQSLSSHWPGQKWAKTLIRERDQKIAQLQLQLQKTEARADPTHVRPEGVSRALDQDRVAGVFILGAPRSGTSIFSWAVGAHPSFDTSAESDFLLTLFGGARLHQSYKKAYDRPDVGWLKQMEVGYREFSAFAGLGIEHLYLDRHSGRRWVDATPGYTLMGEDLLLMFPAAQFLHILRDGRAVVNSMTSSQFPTEWATDFEKACEAWVHYVQRGHALAQAHPDRVLEVRYEALTSQPNDELVKVFRFLNETPCEESVKLVKTQRINSSYGNIKQSDIRKSKKPETAPASPWRDWDAHQRKTFTRIAGPLMDKMGYSVDLEET